MIKKIMILLFIVCALIISAGVVATNYMFDKYLEKPELVDELISDGNIGKEINNTANPSDLGGAAAQPKTGFNKNLSTTTNISNVYNSQEIDNNRKSSTEKIKISSIDKARIITIFKSSLTGSDIRELEHIAASRPLTKEKIARSKEILNARLTKQQKEELKQIYRKYY